SRGYCSGAPAASPRAYPTATAPPAALCGAFSFPRALSRSDRQCGVNDDRLTCGPAAAVPLATPAILIAIFALEVAALADAKQYDCFRLSHRKERVPCLFSTSGHTGSHNGDSALAVFLIHRECCQTVTDMWGALAYCQHTDSHGVISVRHQGDRG